MLKYKKGNLVTAWLSNEVDILVHSCNCFHTFGSGIAKEIRERIPEAYQADLKTERGSVFKLGDYTQYEAPNGQLVINLYGQYDYGRTGQRYTEYGSLNLGLGLLGNNLDLSKPYVIGVPKLGCGLGGGDWELVESMLEFHLSDWWDVTVYEL